jgi:hypothetical protein
MFCEHTVYVPSVIHIDIRSLFCEHTVYVPSVIHIDIRSLFCEHAVYVPSVIHIDIRSLFCEHTVYVPSAIHIDIRSLFCEHTVYVPSVIHIDIRSLFCEHTVYVLSVIHTDIRSLFCEHTVYVLSVIHIDYSVPGRMLSKPEHDGMNAADIWRGVLLSENATIPHREGEDEGGEPREATCRRVGQRKSLHLGWQVYKIKVCCGTKRLKCNGTHRETRIRLSAKRTSPFKSAGASVQSTTGSRVVRISDSNAGNTMFRGSVKSTGYTLHSPVSPSLPPVRHRVPSYFNWTLTAFGSQNWRSVRRCQGFIGNCLCPVLDFLACPGHSMQSLRWTKWQWDKFLSKNFVLPLAVSFHHCWILTH